MNEINTMDVKEGSADTHEEHFAQEMNAHSSEHDERKERHHEDESSETDKGSQADPYSYIHDLLKELESMKEPETKLQHVIDFMAQAIAQTGSPHFKSFWQARGVSLQLFKENLSPVMRSMLWTRYTELAKEARRLKDLLDEQSAFAVEQIEIAVQALETEVQQIGQDISPDLEIENALYSKFLAKSSEFYAKVQTELNILNKLATRINSLRKELIKTEMRVRKKNKFFQRLSLLGDKVFPRRKELINDLSNRFIDDVDGFINRYFKDGLQESLFFLREEIKALQSAAKHLTLNTQAFTQTRMRLSECWDKIKTAEKEFKKERAQQKTVFKENMDQVVQKIEECKTLIQAGETPPAECNKKLDEVVAFMRTIELGRDELQELRAQISAARQPLLDLLKTEEQKRHEQEQERQRQKQQKIHDLKHEIDQLLRSTDIHDAAELVASRDAILEKIQAAQILKAEKQELERLLKPLKDVIADKKALSLTALSADDRQALQQLKDVLQERRALRQEIKDQVEALRKVLGSSKLDFERAMDANAQMHTQKERLDKINQAILEIEEKIASLEEKV